MTVKLKQSRALGTLSLTPLIDVVFMLLIFFLVTARFEQQEREIPVVLPSASEAQPITVEANEITITINLHGQFFVDGKLLTAPEVSHVLEKAAADNPNRSVVIRADERVQLRPVVVIMNYCNAVGLYDYTLTADDDN